MTNKKNKSFEIEQKRFTEFANKYPKINKMPFLKNILRWMYKEGWFYSISLIVVCLAFLLFGLNHLGKFISVDEPKWVNTRVPQFFEAIKEKNWSKTYINDKPGVIPVILSGSVNIFLDHDIYKSKPLEYENYLFWWRLPIVLFNFILLFFIYIFIKKLLNKNVSLLCTSLIALNPVLIGLSQIVNPDSTLWSLSFLSFIIFLLHLKSNNKKYIYISGIFLGLALLSKYVAAMLFIIFFFSIIIEYLMHNKHSLKFLYGRFSYLFILFITAILTYFIFLPACWVKPYQAINGTINTPFLSKGYILLIPFILLFFIDLIILKGKIINLIRGNNFIKYFIRILSTIIIFFILYLILNSLIKYHFFNFDIFLYDYVKTISDYHPLYIIQASFYSLLLTLTWPLLIGFILVLLSLIFNKKININIKFILIISFIFITTYIISSSIIGLHTSTRYLSILYPIIALIAAIIFMEFIKKHKIYFFIVVLFFGTITVLSATPFYYHYSNSLNFNNSVVTDAWGYGGYELAQELNKIPGIENFNVWTDREGFDIFYKGTSLTRTIDPFEKSNDVDFLVLTKAGKKIFDIARRGMKTKSYVFSNSEISPILDLYSKKSIYQININNNPNNYIKIISNN